MEYSVLGIPINSSLKDAQKALKDIRARYHPDRRQNQLESVERKNEMRKFVMLAEEAYDRIKKREEVNTAINSLVVPFSTRTLFQPFTFPSMANTFTSDVLSNMENPPSNNRTHVETYSYSNINGEINESASINGRVLTKDELEKKKKNKVTRLNLH